MWFTSLLLSLLLSSGRCHEGRLRRRKTHRNPAPHRRSFVPQLEILEDRTVLSTLTVLNTLDKGTGSLRDTITKAKDGDTIVFASSLDGQTITLTSDQLTINKSLDIEGPGASRLAISGNDSNRVFNINEWLTVTIDGLTITHGQAGGDGNGGGGILNNGSAVSVASDVFSYNVAASNNAGGGAITIRNGATLSVTDSTFLGNQAIGSKNGGPAFGGAIWDIGSAATVTGSTFTGNRAIAGAGSVPGLSFPGLGVGGGITNIGTLTIVNSTFTGNQAIGGNGGSGGTAPGLGEGGGVSTSPAEPWS